ncbi:MAG: hypothetical protein FIA92_07160 [Chloroflexi bacterium]|nr:hypothetical protein [Chloroflexota bacterium]
MVTLARPRRPVPQVILRLTAPAPIAPLALLLLAMALGGLGLTVLGRSPSMPATPATVIETEAAHDPHGDVPLIGDPIRELTIWWSDRLADANKGALDSMRGRALTPIDPLEDAVVQDLYGKILLVTIPLLTLGGMILGYLIMTSRTSGESAYTARAVTPRFVVGATLSILGLFLVSVLAQFVIATDLAMVGVSLPDGAVGDPHDWPASGGVFTVLQHASFDPRVPEGPGNWNTGAWLSAGLSAAVLLNFVQILNSALGGYERLLVLVGPICLAAYALPATQRITNLWLRLLLAILSVRFAWTIVFVLFSVESLGYIGSDGNPPTVADTNYLLGLATGAAFLMVLLVIVLIPLALSRSGPLRTES